MLTQTIRITLPRVRAQKDDFIAVERHEWEQLQQYIQELEHAFKVITLGEKELRLGKTRRVASLRELLS